ncbi:MAG: hypothetical protein K6E59_05295 [Bacilli bacterium]|nr:hypothetical protein [Bacilli bacterium]
MKIKIVLKQYGTDFYPVAKTPYLYEDLSEGFALPLGEAKAEPNEEQGKCLFTLLGKTVELSLGKTSYPSFYVGDEHYELELTLEK